jgi:hypothetical protein
LFVKSFLVAKICVIAKLLPFTKADAVRVFGFASSVVEQEAHKQSEQMPRI